MRKLTLCGTLLFVVLLKVISVAQTAPTIDATGRKTAVESLSVALKQNYVFPEVAARTAAFLEKQLATGEYDKAETIPDFAAALTRDLQSQTHDKHLRVRGHAPRPITTPDQDDETSQKEFAREAARQNFAFEKVEHLEGNIGYLDLRGFMPPELAGDTTVAAMSFLANSDAVIFDLRKNGGGDPRLIQLITTYLFDYGEDNTLLNTLYWRKGDRTDQYWTLSYVPGKRLGAKVPVYVLTSSRTFSGGEEFANNLKELKRATIIGETTGGGANPGGGFDLTDQLSVFIPTGRAINPISKKNWEGTGVEPDVRVPADDALKVGYKMALQEVLSKSTDAAQKRELQFLIAGLELPPPTAGLTADKLAKMAGNYGPARIFLENGKLKIQVREGPISELVQLSDDTFTRSDFPDVRFQFVADRSGNYTKLLRTTAEQSNELPRSK